MLTTSRAVVHAPWRPIQRCLIYKLVAPSLVENRKANYTTAINSDTLTRLRLADDFIGGDTCGEWLQPSTRGWGKAPLRNYATSPSSLLCLVQEGKYEEASVLLLELRSRNVEVFTHHLYERAVRNLLSQEAFGTKDLDMLAIWLDLLPEVQHSPPNLLQGLSDDMRRLARTQVTVVIFVGHGLSRKGYRTLVENDILPYIEQIPTFIRFKDELEQSLAQFESRVQPTRSSIELPSEVFEDTSEDYTSVMAASAPPPPSVLEIVEATLPPILPASGVADGPIFEDEILEDYNQRTFSHHISRESPADRLHHLIGQKHYDDAFLLLKELNSLQTEIPRSIIYETVALDALQRSISDEYTVHNRLDRFTSWLSLIPLSHEKHGPNHLNAIQRAIMHSSLTDLVLVMHFTTILAQKGYANAIRTQSLAVVMRFASSDAIHDYIQSLENAGMKYWMAYQPEKAQIETNRFSGRIRSAAVRFLAYAGRVEDAVTLLPQPESGVRLSTYTYDMLLRTIRDSGKSSYLQFIPLIESLQNDGGGLIQTRQLRDASHTDVIEQESMVMAEELRTANPIVQIKHLPETLRYLKHALIRAEDNPHPFVVAEFLERYLATGRWRAPTMLLNLALRSSYHSASIFLFAEMLYYQRMGYHHLVIQTFMDHFYLSGVPREDVLRLYHETSRIQTSRTPNLPSAYDPLDEMEDFLSRVCEFSPSHLPQNKIWPMKIHCNLVWHALIALTPADQELEKLYDKLLRLARLGQDDFQFNPQSSSIKPLLPPPSWRQPFNCAVFTPFMRRLMFAFGPQRGAKVITDMLSLGIEPSVYHFTELAGHYARKADITRALMVLDQLEASSNLKGQLQQQQKERQQHLVQQSNNTAASLVSSPTTSGSTSPYQKSNREPETLDSESQGIPEPDLVIYISIMRGFLISHCIDGFEAVHARLIKIRKYLPKHRFSSAQEKALNEVYQDFRMLSRGERYDWPRERKKGYYYWLECEVKNKEENNLQSSRVPEADSNN